MKADARSIVRGLDAPTDDVRLYLLHGPDEGGSRALADRIARALGAGAERVDIEGSTLSRDPARLADEAASASLFGDRRYIRVRVAGDEAAAAVAALLEAPRAGNPVVMIAPQLKPSSATLKAALAAPAALAFASYAPEGAEAGRVVAEIAREAGLRLTAELAMRIAEECAGDRARIASEVEKLMLLTDAAPDRPRDVTPEMVDQLGSGTVDDAPATLANDSFAGRIDDAAAGLIGLGAADRTPLLRASQRRALLLLELRARIEAGESPEAVLGAAARSLFWKDKAPVTAQARSWSAETLERVMDALVDAELGLRGTGSGVDALDRALVNVARTAARRR